MLRQSAFAIAAAFAALTAATTAQAHPKLLSSTPAANATVTKPTKLELHFSEKLVSKFSGAELIMTGMPGMAAQGPMRMGVASKVAGDGKTLVVTSKKPLPAGDYLLKWHAVAGDSHRINGSYSFKVN